MHTSIYMLKILLVDDHYASCILLKMLLEENNYQVTMAHDGQEVLSKNHIQDFDVVILDWKMPKIDGDIVAQKIWQKRSNVPIILISAHEIPERVKKLPFIAILPKPVDTDYLMKILNNIRNNRNHD